LVLGIALEATLLIGAASAEVAFFSNGTTLRPKLWPNLKSSEYPSDKRAADAIGVVPVRITRPADLAAFKDYKEFKFVVTKRGDLMAVPKVEPGNIVKHPVAANNESVLAAGIGRLRGDKEVIINHHTGHYQVDKETIFIAKRRFEFAGFKVHVSEGEIR